MKPKDSRLVLILTVAIAWLLLIFVVFLVQFYRREPLGLISVLGIVIEFILLFLLLQNLLIRLRLHPNILKHYIISLDVSDIKAKANLEQPFFLELGKRPVEVKVRPNKIFDDGCEAIELTDYQERHSLLNEIITYSGIAVGAEESSEVRLAITESIVTGYVMLKEGWWFIEPLRKFQPDANPQDYLVYRTKDLQFRLPYGDDVRPKMVEQQDNQGSNPPHRVNPTIGVVVLADREYFNENGYGYRTEQSALINNINGIYQRTLGCELRVRDFLADLRPNSLNTTNASQLLNQMEDPINLVVVGDLRQVSVREASGVEIGHLTTGKVLDNGTLGIAWQPGVYSLSQQHRFTLGGGGFYFSGTPGLSYQNMMVAAHEIAHNFDGEHNESDEWCVANFIWCWDFVRTIMWPIFYDDNQDFFSDGSRNTSHNNKRRIKDNMASGRNHNF